MNARLYDPVVGRFLSPDPYVQNPENTQNYNRYSYALNNPLKYTDPSGEKYEWDHSRGCYVDEWGRSVDYSTVFLEMFYNGRFRGPTSPWDFSNIWQPAVVGGGNNSGRGGQWVVHTNNYYSQSGNGPVFWEGQTSSIEWEWNTISNINNGIAFTVGGLQTSAGNALGRTLRYQSTASKIVPQKVMIKVPGGSLHVGTNAMKTAAKGLKYGGRALGIAGLGITVLQFADGQISGTEALIDGVFGVVGFFGPVGLGISLVYFGGKFAYEQISGNTLFDKTNYKY